MVVLAHSWEKRTLASDFCSLVTFLLSALADGIRLGEMGFDLSVRVQGCLGSKLHLVGSR